MLSQEHTPIRVSGGSRTRRYGVHSAACHSGTLPTPSVSGRSGSRTRKAVSGLNRFPGGSRRRSGGPSVTQSSRVDSNHRSFPCQGTVLAAERRDESAPRAGIEPATPRSRRGMISVSPSGQQRKARESNPHLHSRRTALAPRPGQPYPATFRNLVASVDPPGIEVRISATPHAVSSLWTTGPVYRYSGPGGR